MGNVTASVNGNEITKQKLTEMQLERAYHVLDKMKKLLGPDKLRELYAEECKITNERYIAAKKNSRPGYYKKADVSLFAEGCCFKDWMEVYVGGKAKYTHPEHFFVMPINGDFSNTEVMEVLGEEDTMFRLKMHRNVDLETFPFQADPDCTFVLRAEITTMDDEPLGIYAFHQFKDRENGLEANVCIAFPEGADDALVEGQKRHLAIEFYNWLSTAVELAKEKKSAT